MFEKLMQWIYDLLVVREYREIDGILCVRERGGDWEPLEEHLKRENPEEFSKLSGHILVQDNEGNWIPHEEYCKRYLNKANEKEG